MARRAMDEPLFYVVVCSDTACEGFGGLAGPHGWVRPQARRGGWLIFATSGLAAQWALANIGPNKSWTISPMLSRVAVAAPF